MAHVVLYYSEPVADPQPLLTGSLAPQILGYRNLAISTATNVLKKDIQVSIYAPAGYYVESPPSVTQSDPKGMLYVVVTTAVCFSKFPKGARIQRVRGSHAGYTG